MKNDSNVTMSTFQTSTTFGIIPLHTLILGTFTINNKTSPLEIQEKIGNVRLLEKKQSYLMAVFRQEQDIFQPILRKTKIHNVFDTYNDESWIFMDALRQFFLNNISLTSEIRSSFPEILLGNALVGMTLDKDRNTLSHDIYRYSNLRRDKKFENFVNQGVIKVIWF